MSSMTVEASLSKCAHPPRSNLPRSSSSRPPGPCITPSTETCVVVVSFMVAVPFSLVWSSFGWCRSSRQSSPASTGFGRILGQDRVDLLDGLLQAPHSGELLHRLDGRKLALDRHPGLPAADLLDGHPHGRHRELAVRRAVLVGEAVAEVEPVRRLDLVHLPEPAGLIALRPAHVVLDAAVGRRS